MVICKVGLGGVLPPMEASMHTYHTHSVPENKQYTPAAENFIPFMIIKTRESIKSLIITK